MQKIRVWDVPTRVGHWMLASAFIVALASGDSEAMRLVHVTVGLTFTGVLAFRLFWGVAGTRYARFTSFLFSPREVYAYLRSIVQGRADHWVGHNPAGSYAIYLLLLSGVIVAGTGIASYTKVGGDWVEQAHEVVSYLMLGVVGVHVAGVLVSSKLHRENLVRSMLDGYKQGMDTQAISSFRPLWLAGLLVIAAAASLLVKVI